MPFGLGFFATAGASAGGGAAFELISTTVLGSEAASVTFGSLDTLASAYTHLQVRAVVRGSGSLDYLQMRWNGLTSGYYSHPLRGDGQGTISSSANTNTGQIILAGLQRSTEGIWSPHVIDILDFSKTTKTKTIRALCGREQSSSFNGIYLVSGSNTSTAAITTITLSPSGSNMSAGSRFSLYGIKA